jgi:hypothetical protein
MSTTKNSICVELGEIENTCFVIMPFDSLFQTQYERVIRPAVEQLGLKCIRGDEMYSRPQVMVDIWKSIRKSRLLIAELTDKDPNVFYEIGLAHALGKPIILLTRNEDDVPFDLKALRYRYYDVNDPFWGENLQKAIQSMILNVLDQANFSSYLEGISATLQIPAPPEPSPSPLASVTPAIDISGPWRAEWKLINGTIVHRGIIYITQQDSNLSGILTVTFEKKSALTVVQEVLTGSIEETAVSLTGTSYTYIQQGNSSAYHLDNFNLSVDPQSGKMAGESSDPDGGGTATFVRLEST